MKCIINRLILAALMTAVLSACATTVAQPKKRFFWPPVPDEPKIEWIATYFSNLDIKEKTFMSEIVGDDTQVVLKRPVSVASDGEGRFVTSDQEMGQVFMFDLNKQEVSRLGGAEGAVDFKQPSGVAVDSEGNFYVADNSTRKVYVVNSKNSILRVMDFSSQVISIGSLIVDRARARLIIPDAKGSKVIICALTGELRSTVEGKGYFTYPNAVAVASDGSLFIVDTFSARVLRFTAEGKYLSYIGKRGDSAGNLTLPTGVAVDSEDHIYVTDGRLHTVTIFDIEGNSLLVVGGPHSTITANIGRGGFQIPQGISVDKNDRIYVADSFNRRIQVFQYLNARYLRDYPIEQPKP